MLVHRANTTEGLPNRSSLIRETGVDAANNTDAGVTEEALSSR